MGTIAAFTTAYLTPTVLPAGDRQQLAGIVYTHADFLARGGSGTPPRTKRNDRIVYAAARDAITPQANLVSDFYALNAP